MDKITEINQFLDTLDLKTSLTKHLYLEQLLTATIKEQLSVNKSAALIRNYFQVTAYLNFLVFTESANLVECCRELKILHKGKERTLLHVLAVYSLLQVSGLGVPDHQLDVLAQLCEDYIYNLRPLLLTEISKLCAS